MGNGRRARQRRAWRKRNRHLDRWQDKKWPRSMWRRAGGQYASPTLQVESSFIILGLSIQVHVPDAQR